MARMTDNPGIARPGIYEGRGGRGWIVEPCALYIKMAATQPQAQLVSVLIIDKLAVYKVSIIIDRPTDTVNAPFSARGAY